MALVILLLAAAVKVKDKNISEEKIEPEIALTVSKVELRNEEQGKGMYKHNAILDFLNSLDDKQLSKLVLKFDHDSKEAWHYFPPSFFSRKGIKLKELSKQQKIKFEKFLLHFLSESGYEKTQQVIQLEQILAELEDNFEYRDPGNYFIAFYGNPKTDSLWSWSYEGHHLSLNFTILKDKITSSPRFFGADPATVKRGKHKGMRTLGREVDLAFDLLNSMTPAQKHKTIFSTNTFYDITTSNDSKVEPLRLEGIPTWDLNKTQKKILQALINEYINAIPKQYAKKRSEKINAEEFDDIYFGWAGATNPKDNYYFRIQGKSFLIEFDNSRDQANHIHTVWRDFKNDFGRDLIKEHYLNAEHHKH